MRGYVLVACLCFHDLRCVCVCVLFNVQSVECSE